MVEQQREYEGMSEELHALLDSCNVFFALAFTLEMVIKLMRQGINGYFAEGWNVFDFLVTNASLLDLLIWALRPREWQAGPGRARGPGPARPAGLARRRGGRCCPCCGGAPARGVPHPRC